MECHFGYRSSLFKAQPGRWLLLSVSFQFRLGEMSMPIRYAELARTLGVELGERAPLAEVRDAVLRLRRGKGMVLDRADRDTWSAGSFFTNPVIGADTAAFCLLTHPGTPARWRREDQRGLADRACRLQPRSTAPGWPGSPASTRSRSPIGAASAADVVALAREVRDGVERVRRPSGSEPVLIGVSLDA